jgi:hypothetical protein
MIHVGEVTCVHPYSDNFRKNKEHTLCVFFEKQLKNLVRQHPHGTAWEPGLSRQPRHRVYVQFHHTLVTPLLSNWWTGWQGGCCGWRTAATSLALYNSLPKTQHNKGETPLPLHKEHEPLQSAP